MSRHLNMGTVPDQTTIRSHYSDGSLFVGTHLMSSVSINISAADMASMFKYWLTNTDLIDDDPRLKLIDFVKELKPTTGYNPGGTRLEYMVPQLVDPNSEEHQCQNCSKVWLTSQLVVPIPDLTCRVDAGEPMPSGECPECHALCHPKAKA